MFLVFSLTTSTGIAIGIGTSAIYDEESRSAAIVQGVFNALAAGTSRIGWVGDMDRSEAMDHSIDLHHHQHQHQHHTQARSSTSAWSTSCRRSLASRTW